jgi:proteasome-associated ATPase
VHELTTQVAFLEEEVAMLRRRLSESPRQVRVLEERLAEVQADLATRQVRTTNWSRRCAKARDQIVTLKRRSTAWRNRRGYGSSSGPYDDGTVDVFTQGRKLRVTVSPNVDVSAFEPGQEVMLNEALNVVEGRSFERHGDDRAAQGGPRGRRPGARHRAHRRGAGGHTRPAAARRPGPRGGLASRRAALGDAFERIPKSEVEELVLEEVPTSATSRSAG